MELGRYPLRLTLALAGLLLLTVFAGLMIGFAPLSPGEVFAGLSEPFGANVASVIVWEIRLPRLLLGVLVGATLGLSGAALQGLLRNPLADPGVLGVSASAGLGGVFAIYYGLAAGFTLAVPLLAIAAAFVATCILQLMALREASILSIILIGVAINSLAGALTALAMNLAPNPFSLSDMVLWLLGSLANRSYTDIWLAGPFMLAGGAMLLLSGRSLTGLALGEDAGATLGVNLNRTRSFVVFGTALAVGASVAVSGTVGFVGLMVPHMLRPFVGYEPGRLLLPSALGGALLLTLADIAVRLSPSEQELKLGVVTALLGAPFFIALVYRTRRAMR
jgi:iron complex transport system permease protein